MPQRQPQPPRLLIVFSLLLAALLGVVRSNDTITVEVSDTIISPSVSSDFASISLEVSNAAYVLSFSGGVRPSYANLMNVLRNASGGHRGGPNIRIGGNSADTSAYVDSSRPLPPNITYRITDFDLSAAAAAAPVWNGSLTPGLNFRDARSAALAVAHVNAFYRVIGRGNPIIQAFEIGNECDLYGSNGIRDTAWNMQDYVANWSMYVRAVANATDEAVLVQGATFCCHKAEFDRGFEAYVQQQRGALSSVSYHLYSLSGCPHNGSTHTWTVYDLLSTSSITQPLSRLQPLIAAARALALPFFVGEGNSCSCGGQMGLSDVFAAALWAIDMMFASAAAGVSRWNFHGGPRSAYTPVYYPDLLHSDAPLVRPVFYGMWMFAEATRGGAALVAANVTSSNELVRAWAVTCGAGCFRVVILHKDGNASAAARASVSFPSPCPPSASIARLVAPSLHSPTGAAFAGQTFDGTTDGLPVGKKVEERVQAHGGVFEFEVGAGSALLLSVGE